MKSAWLQGAKRVIAIDDVPERLEMARQHCQAETIDFSDINVYDVLQELTNGRGPDKCIDAVGAEAHTTNPLFNLKDSAREVAKIPTNHPYVLNEMIMSCRKGGTLSIPGVYTAHVPNLAMGPAMNKGLTFKMGQTHVQKFLPLLMNMVVDSKIDPSFLITHTVPLSEAPAAYAMFNDKKDNCVKVVLKP